MSTFYTTNLSLIYGADLAAQVAPRLQNLVEQFRRRIPAPAETHLTEHDAFLITYADQVHRSDEKTLKTLGEFCESNLRDLISGIHILPFFPWSSDDGFSVMDYPYY